MKKRVKTPIARDFEWSVTFLCGKEKVTRTFSGDELYTSGGCTGHYDSESRCYCPSPEIRVDVSCGDHSHDILLREEM